MNLGVDSLPLSRRIASRKGQHLRGDLRFNSDGTPYWLARVYNGTGGALTANRPYMLTFSGASTTAPNPRVTALAAAAGVPTQVVIAHEAIADASWGWVCFQGYHDCGIEGTTDVAAGDFLKIDAAVSTTGLIKDATSRSSASCAIACEAQASNSVVDKRVFLIGGAALSGGADNLSMLTLAAGTSAAPTLNFTGATTTGLYLEGGNAVGTTVGGSGKHYTTSTALTMVDGINIAVGTSTGTKIATATGQKLGFWNATPVVQPSAYTQTFSTADRTHAARTATTLTDNTAGTANTTLQALSDGTTYANDVAAIRNNFADLAAAVNALIADLADTAGVVNALVDDHQALGLCA